MPSYYPPTGFHFRVEFDLAGVSDNDMRFQEVSGLTAKLGTEELVEGGENRFAHRLPTRGDYGNLVLKRGLLTDSGLISWMRDAIENFQFDPVDVMVSLLNEEHEPLVSWSFRRTWPVQWAISDLSAQDNSLVIETIELVYSYYTKV